MTDLMGRTTEAGCGAGCASRRAVLAGVAGAAALLAGCQTYGQNADPEAAAADLPTDTPATEGAATPGATSGATPGATPGAEPTGPGATKPAAPAAKALVEASRVPVGGGVILEGERLVVTQPQQGVYKAFSAVCTHQGCVVTEVRDGIIECGCHGSRFRATDGSVAGGPATRALRETRVKADGPNIVRA